MHICKLIYSGRARERKREQERGNKLKDIWLSKPIRLIVSNRGMSNSPSCSPHIGSHCWSDQASLLSRMSAPRPPPYPCFYLLAAASQNLPSKKAQNIYFSIYWLFNNQIKFATLPSRPVLLGEHPLQLLLSCFGCASSRTLHAPVPADWSHPGFHMQQGNNLTGCPLLCFVQIEFLCILVSLQFLQL